MFNGSQQPACDVYFLPLNFNKCSLTDAKGKFVVLCTKIPSLFSTLLMFKRSDATPNMRENKMKNGMKKTNSSSSSRSWKRAGECVEVDGKVEKTRNNLNRKYIARHSQNKSIIPKNTALSSCSHGLQTFTFFQSLSLLLVYYNSWYFLFLCWHRRWLHAAVQMRKH